MVKILIIKRPNDLPEVLEIVCRCEDNNSVCNSVYER